MRVAELFVSGLTQVREQEGHEHVATLADLVVDGLPLEFVAGVPKRFLPREHVAVVAVDQRAVDVEQDCFDRQNELPLCYQWRRPSIGGDGDAGKLGPAPWPCCSRSRRGVERSKAPAAAAWAKKGWG